MKATWENLERERRRAQAVLDASRAQVERNRLGQFATPGELARGMVRLARAYWMPPTSKVRFLDPGVGTGAFHSATLSEFPSHLLEHAVGIESDTRVAEVADRLWGGQGLEVRHADFTKLAPPNDIERANLIVANPPYVRHHHLAVADKRRLQARVASELGLRVSGLAGLYCYFLLLSHPWLQEGGLAAWLIPSEFCDVNYGSVLREYLTRRVTLLRIHRFDPANVQFDDALVSSVVLLFRKTPPPEEHRVSCTLGGSLDEPLQERLVLIKDLRQSERWTAIVNGEEGEARSGPRLGDFFSIKRGIATGANSFFILPRKRAQQLGLPEASLRPILPSPRHLRGLVVEGLEDGFPDLSDPLVLLNCTLAESEVNAKEPALYSYFKSGEAKGLRSRYLLSRRTPWYEQEERPPAPFLCTYMGRGTGRRKPFRFIWNRSKATAPNVYLLLYPIGPLKEALRARPELAAEVFDFLTEIDAGTLRNGGRVYGGALHKVEPKELASLPAEALAKIVGRMPGAETQLDLLEVGQRAMEGRSSVVVGA